MDKVKVAVRVRPVNRREKELGTKCVVDMENNQTILHSLKEPGHDGRKASKTFAFDHCFWSMMEGDPRFQGQEEVFEALGVEILERAYEGYNGCIFAYGQTGSGKSYSMMGTHEQKGIIPRLCDAMFENIKTNTKEDLVYKVEVSYMEIYNEKVHDLLDLKGNKQNLKVREHSILGPYVDGLSMLAVSSFEDVNNLMNEGNKSRTVAATNMNNESSRSHAVFNIVLTQTLTDLASGVSGEKVSKLSLVDLAGSERAQKTGAVGDRLKEGSNINKSLTTLGLVISSLADAAAGKNKNKFVPYRDSVLTWLLKDNLGGNSKTVMIATISPAGDNYEETLSTLRYADRAKRIVNHAVVNEDPNARIIRDLREELEMLRNQLRDAQSMQAPDLKDRLQESEHLMKEMTKTWEEKLKETDQIHTQRHNALEQMGISVETSGIKVEQGRAFLVNLNADPSLNELLVYYLKEHTLVGSHNARVKQDIHLSGLGILPEHCVVDIDNNEIFLTPFDGARTCVNGSVIKDKTKVKHGDRILWGNNHFFRVNCPKPTNSPQSTEPENQLIDYDFAQHELMMKELGDDPIQEAIGAIEKQHEEEKQEALDKQRQMYERQMQMLRNKLMSPGNPSFPMQLFEMPRLTPTGNPTTQNSIQKKYQQWAVDREKSFKQSLSKLREEVVKANTLVREGNFLSQEMNKQTEFHVTLQIPASNLSPNRRRGAFISEPAILVKRQGRPNQIWSMEKLENKVIDMREVYEERRNRGLPMMVSSLDCSFTSMSSSFNDSGLTPAFSHPLDNVDEGPPQKGDPFYESQENHNLIGVANVFLDCLFYDVKLDYHVPIISQQGEITGKLHIELSKVGGAVLDRYVDIHESGEENSVPMGAPLLVRVCIKEARGLPPALCHFVFCQYSFWGLPETIVVAPEINPDNLTEKHDQTLSFIFNHQKDFRIPITEEFIEHCSEGALSIEVWGHRSQGFGLNGSLIDSTSAKTRTLIDRWNEVMRKIEFWVEIHELNDQGEYVAVETTHRPDVPCAGIFQLRQGHSRRVLVRVKPVANSGTLPLICEAITSISVGCITARSKLQKGLDSYQEEDLNHLRERWTDALKRRKEYLDEQIQQLINKPDKSEADAERERALIEQWVSLTEERNAVLVPAPGSCIPGAPADWDPPPNVEEHSPVLFLDLNADDMSTPNTKEGLQAAGVNSILPKEHGSQLINLPITKSFTEKENVCAVASWDSSIHDSQHLNRVTPANERIYVILKAVVRLSHPASMELVLRKRLCINIYKKQSLTSFTHMLKNRIIGTDYLTSSSIIYEVVSNIPKGSEDLEEMETLAQMAASPNQINSSDGETYIEKYIRGISAVESILTLDRLRQEVAVKELLAVTGRSGGMLRKTTSVPNINQILTSPTKLEEQIRADSISDLSFNPLSPKSQHYPGGSKSVMSPHSLKLMKPMTTLLEEQNHREQKPLLHQSTEEELDEEDEDDLGVKPVHHLDDHQQDSDDFQEFESFQSQQTRVQNSMNNMTHSSTNDSLVEGQNKSYTPSMTSSGYASQAVSTLTLSSEDSMSIKSIEEQGDGKGKKMRQKSASTETSSESDSDDRGNKNNNSDQLKEEDGTHENLDDSMHVKTERSDSLLDENVPDIPGSPLKPIPSPPVTADPFFQSNDLEFDNQTKESEADTKDSEIGQKTTEPESNPKKDSNELEKSEKTNYIKESENKPDSEPKEDSESSKAESPATGSKSVRHRPKLPVFDDSSAICVNSVNGPENDLYSVNALEELEKLQDIDEDHEESSQPISDKSHLNRPISDECLNTSSNEVKSLDRADVLRRKGSSGRPRPVSCVGSPQTQSLYRTGLMPEADRRSSLHFTDEQAQGFDDSMSECSFGSRADLDRILDIPIPSWVKEGEGVTVTSSRGTVPKSGVVKFVGQVDFAAGNWIGVELDQPEGKNDGSVNKQRYFKCRSRHGIFVRPDKLIWDKKRKSVKGQSSRRSSGMTSSASSGSLSGSKGRTPTKK